MFAFRGSLWRLWIVAASGLMLLARPYPAWACSCMQPATPAVAFGDAEAVFTGTVTGIRDGSPPPWLVRLLLHVPGYSPPWDNTRVTFHVNSAWKGLAEDAVTVRTGQGDADCGFTFATGGQYLVYTYTDSGEHLTNTCLRTNDLRFATQDLTYLQTQSVLTLAPAGAASAWPLAAVGGLLALALAAVGAVFWLGMRAKAEKAG